MVNSSFESIGKIECSSRWSTSSLDWAWISLIEGFGTCMRTLKEVKSAIQENMEFLKSSPDYKQHLDMYIEDLMLITLISMRLYPDFD
jgi:hypothetical protein